MASQQPRSVTFVTGPADDGLTAIGDYTTRLVDALRTAGLDAQHVEHEDWGLAGIRTLRRHLDGLSPTILHIQHPMGAYGRSLGPQWLSLTRPTVVTLHEASRYGPLRGRARLLPFLLRPKGVILTSDFERDYVRRFAPWTSRHLAVIPIASNIPGLPRAAVKSPSVVYFGSLRPGKGLEAFLAYAKARSPRQQTVELEVIGNPVPTSRAYADGIRRDHADLSVTWRSNLSPIEVARRLSQASVAYLPFPDGVSERRGSVLAAFGCGLPVVSTIGPHTTPALRNAISVARNEREAVAVLDRLLVDGLYWEQMSARGRAYAARFHWDEIAQRHLRLYRRVDAPVCGDQLPGPQR